MRPLIWLAVVWVALLLVMSSVGGDNMLIEAADGEVIPSDDLEAQYNVIEDADPLALVDVSGNGRNGTLCGGAQTPAWITSDRLDFDNDCVDFPSSLSTVLNGIADASLYYVVELDENTPVLASNTGFDYIGPGTGANRVDHYPFTDGLYYLMQFRVVRLTGFNDLSGIARDSWHVFCVTTESGGLWSLYRDTTLITTLAAEATVSVVDPMQFGWTQAGATFHFNGRNAYMLFYSAHHDATAQEEVYAGLQTAVATKSIILP